MLYQSKPIRLLMKQWVISSTQLRYFEAFREHVSISQYKKNLMEKSEEFRRQDVTCLTVSTCGISIGSGAVGRHC